MKKRIRILDSTLRDGGYCNDWRFGYDNKKLIIAGLVEANIDIVECGILTRGNYDLEVSKFCDISKVSELLPDDRNNKLFVVLMNYGEYDVEKLPDCSKSGVDGIRIAFHKKDLEGAIQIIKMIKAKKYKVFMQPMVTVSYSEEEYRQLLKAANEINPYALYIVDSFGSMNAEAVQTYFLQADRMLNRDIVLGFHSHNNLQLAYSNSQLFVEKITNRNIIVDCCIMGMGRGAGNLNTELFLNYMNSVQGEYYKIEPILGIIDQIINYFYKKKYWGYSLPNYLSAIYNIHPNYAAYLVDKNTLTVAMLGELLSLIDIVKKNVFDKDYIEGLYLSYMCANNSKQEAQKELADIFSAKDVLLIAPGKSIDIETDKIRSFVANQDVISVSINFDCSVIKTDYIFVSNPKRFEELEGVNTQKLITTSNIHVNAKCIKVDYFSLLCDEKYVRDNAAMMFIKLLIHSGAKHIYLAGLDGYNYEPNENYSKQSVILVTSNEQIDYMNKGMNKMLDCFGEKIDISFVTSEKMIRRNK